MTSDASDTPSGLTVPGYDGFRLLGRGGFSAVYQARQIAYDRQVALKVLDVGVDDEALRRRLSRERAVTGRLTGHPNIVTILDSGFLPDGRPYLAMALCPGGSLADRLRQQGPLPVPDVLRIGVRIAGALQTAHQHEIVHRDIKPENILITALGEPALADFGISTVTDHGAFTRGTAAYTPNHAPPEVLRGESATAASDIYNLGSTLHQLLAGSAPFALAGGGALAAFVDQVLNADPPPLDRSDVPPSLAAALRRAMAKDPAARFGTAAEFGTALQRVQQELGLRVDEIPVMAAGVRSPDPHPAGPPTGHPGPPTAHPVGPPAGYPAGAATILPPAPGPTPGAAPLPVGAATILPPAPGPTPGAALPVGAATILPPAPGPTPGAALPAGAATVLGGRAAPQTPPPRPDPPRRGRFGRWALVLAAVLLLLGLGTGGTLAYRELAAGDEPAAAGTGGTGELAPATANPGDAPAPTASPPAATPTVAPTPAVATTSASPGRPPGGGAPGGGAPGGGAPGGGAPTATGPAVRSLNVGDVSCNGSAGEITVRWEIARADNVQIYGPTANNFLGTFNGASGAESFSFSCQPGERYVIRIVPQANSTAGAPRERSGRWPSPPTPTASSLAVAQLGRGAEPDDRTSHPTRIG